MPLRSPSLSQANVLDAVRQTLANQFFSVCPAVRSSSGSYGKSCSLSAEAKMFSETFLRFIIRSLVFYIKASQIHSPEPGPSLIYVRFLYSISNLHYNA